MSFASLNWCEIPELFPSQNQSSASTLQLVDAKSLYSKDDWKLYEEDQSGSNLSLSDAMDLEDLSVTEYLFNLGNDELESSSYVLTQEPLSTGSPHSSPPRTPLREKEASEVDQKLSPVARTPEKQEYPWTRTKLKPSSLEEQVKIMQDRRKKDALAAKQNREKKKKYVTELEQNVDELKKENASLKRNATNTMKTVEDLKSQIAYLKGVLANQSQLAVILNSLSSASGLNLCSSAVQVDDEMPRKKARRDEGEVNTTSKSSNAKTGNDKPTEDCPVGNEAGVCLHVTQNKVSLEFCGSCSKMASIAQPIKNSGNKENQS